MDVHKASLLAAVLIVFSTSYLSEYLSRLLVYGNGTHRRVHFSGSPPQTPPNAPAHAWPQMSTSLLPAGCAVRRRAWKILRRRG